MMKSFFVAALCAAVTTAQMVVIFDPPANTTLSPGQNFTVEVDRPVCSLISLLHLAPHLISVLQDTLTNSLDISVAIGLLPCAGRAPPGTCDGVDPSEGVGAVLFAGPYQPVLIPGSGSASLKQNYTVTVPDGFPSGPAALSVSHFALIGVSNPVRPL